MSSFFKQVWILTWKNYLLKKRHLSSSIIDLMLPFLFLIFYLANFGLLTPEDSSLTKYFESQEFLVFFFYLGIWILTFVNLCRFVNFHMPQEQFINITSTLKIMNVNPIATDLSFILI